MKLREEAVACLRANAGKAFRPFELARLIVESNPEKYEAKRQRSGRFSSAEGLIKQVRCELAAEHNTIIARHPEIATERIGGKRLYRWAGPHG